MNLKLLRFVRLAAFVLIAALAGFYTSLLLRPEPPPTVEMAGPERAEPAMTLPVFSLTDTDGNLRSIDDFTGRPLLINFWATWCAPCLRELPMFEAVWQARRLDHSLQILGIAIDRLEDVLPYIKDTGVTYPNLVGQSDAMEIAGSFGPDYVGLPFTVLVSSDRQILLMHSVELFREQLDEILAISDEVAAGRLSVVEARTRLTRR